MSEAGGRILVVEDDAALRLVITGALTRAGYAVESVPDGLQAVEQLAGRQYEIVLLDIGLPFVDGWRILHTLEGQGGPSVVVISARGDERDKVRALDMGADDYLTKPFGAAELEARVRAVLRRVRGGSAPGRIVCGAVIVDLAAKSVTRHGEEVRLSPTEYVLLVQLAEHAGSVLDHRTLLTRVWGPQYAGDRNYLHTFIQRLRRKLEDDPANPVVIVTVGRHGYRFGPPA